MQVIARAGPTKLCPYSDPLLVLSIQLVPEQYSSPCPVGCQQLHTELPSISSGSENAVIQPPVSFLYLPILAHSGEQFVVRQGQNMTSMWNHASDMVSLAAAGKTPLFGRLKGRRGSLRGRPAENVDTRGQRLEKYWYAMSAVCRRSPDFPTPIDHRMLPQHSKLTRLRSMYYHESSSIGAGRQSTGHENSSLREVF